MTISAPLRGSAGISASFPGVKPPQTPSPGRGAHPSQTDLIGQHGLADKLERGTQQTLGKRLDESQVWSHLVAKPGHLALCVSPGRTLSCGNRGTGRQLAPQI